MSDACQQYFIDEACLYECDEHAGRYRKHENCSDPDGNHWQIENMPIKASFWDGWYEACKDDLFCGRGYFDMPTCTQDQCSKFSDIYEDGEDLAIAMWGGAFTYETDETNAYTMSFKVGEENPNDSVDHPAAFPNTCEGSSHDSVSFNDLQDCFDAEIKSIETLLAFHAEHSDENHDSSANAKSIETLVADSSANAKSIETLVADSSANAKSIETLLALQAEHSDEIETLLAFQAEHSDKNHDDSSSIAIAGVALAALACVLAFIAIIRGGKAGAAKSPNFN